MNSDKEILVPLAEKTAELSQRPEEALKKKMWADHQALKGSSKIPVCVYCEGIPKKQWEHMSGAVFRNGFDDRAGSIEVRLRRRRWAAGPFPDDHIVWNTLIVRAFPELVRGWGVDLAWTSPDDELGAQTYDPPFRDGIDMNMLTKPVYAWDMEEIDARICRAEDLTGGLLTVFPEYKYQDYAPFDIAVEMRGMENLLMDVITDPGPVKELLTFITSSLEEYERIRSEQGLISVFPGDKAVQQYGFRVHCAHLASDFDKRAPELRDEWIYISAETSAGLGPDRYAEFVHPFSRRLAAPYSEKTVYYHGCECLDRKIEIIKDLPNMRRFHVSPWSSVEKAAETFQGSMVLEVHDHPGKTFFSSDRNEMKKPIEELIKQAEGHPMDINLSDIHSFNGNPALLTQWAQCAQECAVG